MNEDLVSVMASSRWQRAADRLARYGWLVLLVSVIIAVLGAVVTAALWQPGIDTPQAQVPCADPPCFEGMPGLRDLPIIVPTLGYLFAIVFGVPSLLASGWDFLHGHRLAGGLRLLPFLGPLLVFVGTEIIPHLVNPCVISWLLGTSELPRTICEYDPEWGADFASRWHLLDHTLVGALPLTALYRLTLRRWRPDIVRVHGPIRLRGGDRA